MVGFYSERKSNLGLKNYDISLPSSWASERAMSKKINQIFKKLFFPIFLEIISVTQNPIKASKKRSSVWPMRSQMAIFNGPIWAFIAINCPFSLLFSLSFLPPFFLFSFFFALCNYTNSKKILWLSNRLCSLQFMCICLTYLFGFTEKLIPWGPLLTTAINRPKSALFLILNRNAPLWYGKIYG